MNGRHRRAAPSSIGDGAVPDGRALTAACSHSLLAGATSGSRWRYSARGIPRDGRCCPDRRRSERQHRRRAGVQPGGGSWLPVPGVRRRHDPAAERRIDGVQLAQSANVSGRRQRLPAGWPAQRQRRRRQGHRGCMARHLLVAQRRPGLAQHAAAWLEDRRPRCQGHDTGGRSCGESHRRLPGRRGPDIARRHSRALLSERHRVQPGGGSQRHGRRR